jgi:hypothetical protein
MLEAGHQSMEETYLLEMPQDQKDRVRIPPGYKFLGKYAISMLLLKKY